MANEEHLKILKQSVAQWNKWRLENAIRPDLRDANLTNASCFDLLTRVDLTGANLSGVNLSWVDLTGANLRNSAGALGI